MFLEDLEQDAELDAAGHAGSVPCLCSGGKAGKLLQTLNCQRTSSVYARKMMGMDSPEWVARFSNLN